MATHTTTRPPAAIADRSILIVEDERLVHWSLARALEKAGYVVRIAETGAEALAALSDRRFSLVITDLGLPAGGGLEVAEAIDPATPVIVISASQELTSLAENPKIRNRFEKPFDLGDIVSAVARLLPL